MPEESSGQKESTTSDKYLIRILLIVAIGIPVLLESMTFFNLIKFRLWDHSKSSKQKSQKVSQVEGFSAGDTLLTDHPLIVTLNDSRINVGPNQWIFEMEMRAYGNPSYEYHINIDSLGLSKGIIIPGTQNADWETETENENEGNEGTDEEYLKMEGKWRIPNGEIPQKLFITLQKVFTADSVVQLHKTLPLKKPPIRYHPE